MLRGFFVRTSRQWWYIGTVLASPGDEWYRRHPYYLLHSSNAFFCARNTIPSQTWSHRNFSFSLVLQQYLKPGDGPIVLVLAPTRELAVQIKEECDKFGSSSEIKNTVVYGGVPKSRQVRDLKNGVEIVIATPVRILNSVTSSSFCNHSI